MTAATSGFQTTKNNFFKGKKLTGPFRLNSSMRDYQDTDITMPWSRHQTPKQDYASPSRLKEQTKLLLPKEYEHSQGMHKVE